MSDSAVQATEPERLTEEVADLRLRLQGVAETNSHLQENLSQAMAMLKREDYGWASISGGLNEDGLTLDDLKSWNNEIQNARVGNPHIGHGLMLRQSYIWKGGIQYTLPEPKQGTTNVKNKMDTVSNQRNFFGKSARRRRETALYTGGIYLAIGNDKTHELEPIPLEEITDFARHPRRRSEVIAYRHTYEEFSPKTGESKTVNEWIYVDHYPVADRTDTIKRPGGEAEKVKKGYTAFDLHANGVDDYALGAPDALAALIWTRLVRDLTMDGVTMTHALAAFAFKATTSTATASTNASLALATPQTAGATAKVGGVNDLVPMSSAGKGYDFDSFRFVVATAAAALHVSVIALSADPGAAGSSYGSAQTLDLPTRLAMESRRDEHIEFDSRVLRWMGAKDFDVWFHPYDDATEALRQLQAMVLKWQLGMYEPEEMKAIIEGVPRSDVSVPEGIMIPNNLRYLASLTADDDVTKPTTPSPGQGQANKAGKTGSGSDLRTDTISKESFDRMLALMERWVELEEGLRPPLAS